MKQNRFSFLRCVEWRWEVSDDYKPLRVRTIYGEQQLGLYGEDKMCRVNIRYLRQIWKVSSENKMWMINMWFSDGKGEGLTNERCWVKMRCVGWGRWLASSSWTSQQISNWKKWKSEFCEKQNREILFERPWNWYWDNEAVDHVGVS